MLADILEVWRIHEEINTFFLQRLPDEGFAALTLLKNGQPSKGRTVARVFAHLHEVRVLHLNRDSSKDVPRFETGASPGRSQLIEAFAAGSLGVEKRLTQIVECRDRIKDRTGLALLGYLISHESHHRGQILLACKQSGVRLSDEFRFGIWQHWFRPAF